MSQLSIDAANARPAKETKKGTTVVLIDDAWMRIVPYIDRETLPALECACKTTRDATVFRDVADGSFLLMLTTECHFAEFVKRDGYNAYFQDLFASSLHLKWEALFAKLGDIGMMKEKVPMGVTAGVLHLLKYGNVAQSKHWPSCATGTRGSMTRRCCLR